MIDPRIQQLADEYNSERDLGEICREHAIGPRQLYALLFGPKGPPGMKRRTRRSPGQKPPLSKLHFHVGMKVYDFCLKHDFSRVQAAKKLGWNTLRLRNIEQGRGDATLFELQDLAAFMGTTIGELVNGD